MSTIQHAHAAFDRFPQLVRDLTKECGSEGIGAVVERVIEAEQADFCWEGRISETSLGAYEGSSDDGEEPLEMVAILGIFRGRYYVATCVVDGQERLHSMLRLRHFDGFESAERAFLTGAWASVGVAGAVRWRRSRS